MDPQSPPVASGRRARRSSGWSLLAATCALPLLLGCLKLTTLTSAPAARLSLQATFDGALVPSAMTVISVYINLDSQPAILGAGQRLTCNGVLVRRPDTNAQGYGFPEGTVTVPRQPPGGRYIFVYTDERGRQTTVVVPAPLMDFAITSLAASARVPIPRRVDRGPTAATPTPGQPRPPELADAPLTVRYTVPYPADSLTVEPNSTIEDAVVATAQGARKEGAPPECLQVQSDGYPSNGVVNATGEATVADTQLPYGVGFENLAPGPGSIDVKMYVMRYVPATGFASFHVFFRDDASIPVTWESA